LRVFIFNYLRSGSRKGIPYVHQDFRPGLPHASGADAAGAQDGADIVLYTPTALFVKKNKSIMQNGRAPIMHGH